MKVINNIKFGLLSPDSIREMSHAEIVVPDTYDRDGYPEEGGLMDPRLGVIDPGIQCETCGKRSGDCQGHFGHIGLARPVLHSGFSKDIRNVLQSTCRECSRVLLSDEEIEEYKEKLEGIEDPDEEENLLKKIYKSAREGKEGQCPHCGAEQHEINFDRPSTYEEKRGEKVIELKPTDIRERFEKVDKQDFSLLGLSEDSKPEWMVLTVLPVPPVTARPSITLETGVRSEDDLTHKYVDIIRVNERFKKNLNSGAPNLIVEDMWDLLQYHVTTLIDNQTAGIPPAKHRSGRPLKTLSQRLQGKEGRFRKNLAGKRVDFSSRSVISPDPMIDVDEIGVPLSISKELTIPESVRDFNIEKLRESILNGPEEKNGANYVVMPNGRRKKITEKNKEKIAEEIEVGYKVERHLRDGDIVLFNRQPSLHRMSIMAHRVRVMPYRTFRLNLTVCPPYNADFDGDEMNMHVPQSEEARAEAKLLLEVKENILSPRFGGPIIGGIQDHVTGAYLLSKEEFNRRETEQMLYYSGRDPELPEPNENGKYDGRDLISKLLPDDLDYHGRSSTCVNCDECNPEQLLDETINPDPEKIKDQCGDDSFVYIRDGKMITGVMDEASFGAFKSDSVLDKITREYGNERASEFLNQITKMAIWTITHRGFTTGVIEEDLPEEGKKRINEVLDKKEAKVDKLIDSYRRGEIKTLPGKTERETLEAEIMKELSEARDNSGKIAEEYLGLDNHAVIMARTGARGSLLNITQMAASLGQQSIRGGRPARGYNKRVLSHFKKENLSAKARGFVRSSYKKGLDPEEFFFLSMGGREGLVDTAVRTSESGYLQRRLINALQDLKVDENRNVVDSSGRAIQLEFGEDGTDPSKGKSGDPINSKEIVESVLIKSRKEKSED